MKGFLGFARFNPTVESLETLGIYKKCSEVA